MGRGFRVLRGSLDDLDLDSYVTIYLIASTKTSTIPGISIAGATPQLTLYTPALDVEYLSCGRPRTMDVIPVTPDGLPTPALLTRACLNLLGRKPLVVDSGSYVEPMITHIDLSSRVVGGSIDVENALPRGTSRRLFSEARILGRVLGRSYGLLVIGESMPGGTTTAMSILEALGYRAAVSSSSKDNPLELKRRVVSKALERVSRNMDLFDLNDSVGDPLHISIAGIAVGALERGSEVLLAGGTQMASAVALAKRIRGSLEGLHVATTRWVIEDPTADLSGMLREIAPEVSLAYIDLSFSGSPYPGLRKYDEGYVKEGVGAGGTCLLALLKGYSLDEVLSSIYREYGVLTNYAKT
ncbi:MAG: TIGR00303 family protein [Sulfolobales archaeon]